MERFEYFLVFFIEKGAANKPVRHQSFEEAFLHANAELKKLCRLTVYFQSEYSLDFYKNQIEKQNVVKIWQLINTSTSIFRDPDTFCYIIGVCVGNSPLA